MKLVIAGALALLGLAGGGALGYAFRPVPDGPAPAAMPDPDAPREFVKISRQMIVPVVEGGKTKALMVFEVALDVPAEHRESAYQREPRLRDAFLREMFAMSNAGAFLETYTSERVMSELREKLLAAARLHLDGPVADVLILDALRQEL